MQGTGYCWDCKVYAVGWIFVVVEIYENCLVKAYCLSIGFEAHFVARFIFNLDAFIFEWNIVCVIGDGNFLWIIHVYTCIWFCCVEHWIQTKLTMFTESTFCVIMAFCY